MSPAPEAEGTRLRTGKIPPHLLTRLLNTLPAHGPEVLVGPRLGEDAAAIRIGDRVLVTATDPITFATEEIGWYAVQVNANDVAVMGARPRWFQAVILLPQAEATSKMAESVFAQIAEACAGLGADLVGGHFEVSYDLPRAIVVGQMMGEVSPDGLVTSGGAQPGDVLLLTKGIALEGTALLARELPQRLSTAGVAPAVLERAKNLLRNPGISVVREALAACRAGPPHAMHDPTEGGLATAIAELCAASGVGATIEAARINLLPETKRLCEALGLEPLGLLASGALLIAAAPEQADRIAAAVRAEGIAVTDVGRITEAEAGCLLREADGTTRELPVFAADEVTRVL